MAAVTKSQRSDMKLSCHDINFAEDSKKVPTDDNSDGESPSTPGHER